MILPKQFIITEETQGDSGHNYIDNGTYAVALGIQGPPGLRFWINEDKANDDNSIELGRTGIYELDLSESGGHIISLKIDFNTLNKSKVIIDLLKEEG